MNFLSTRASFSCRGIRFRIQNIPKRICKAILKLSVRVCNTEWIQCIAMVMVFGMLFCSLFGWIFFRDPCFAWEIHKSLCDDYQNGLISGALCYDLCIERTVSLSYCVDQQENISVFKWHDLLVKARRPGVDIIGAHNDTNAVWEGMSHSDFWDVLERFFASVLFEGDHSKLIERAVAFSDFNRDNQISYGEVNALWHLLHIPEFQTLFIFQDNSVFPTLNRTCGSLYTFEATNNQVLYEKNQSSYLDKLFPNRFRWHFPEFPKRAHIALGLLEYAFLVMEESNMRFFMCDFSPENFGYNSYFEMKVSNVEWIVSEHVINKTLTSTSCDSDEDCIYGKLCQTSCNKHMQHCDGVPVNYIPDIIRVCDILRDFILYDTPEKVKMTLSQLILDCVRIGKQVYDVPMDAFIVDQNIVMDRLSNALWEELKYADTKWLTRPVEKPH